MTTPLANASASGAPPGGAWLVAVLAFWLGATALFGAVVAPALFALLPSRALAGVVVGRTLPVVFLAGTVVGLLAAGLALAAPRDAASRSVCLAGGFAMAITCGVAQFVVGARIRRLRGAIGPSLDALTPGDPLRVEFGRLHGLSVALLGVAALAALAVLIACAAGASRSGPHA